MAQVVPWADLCAVIEPYYPESSNGRPPAGMQRALRVTVGVIDKTGGSAVKVVANGLFGVAFLGSITGSVGHMLTGLFETAFQVIPGVGALPSELSCEKNGLMFGNRLIRETGSGRMLNTPVAFPWPGLPLLTVLTATRTAWR